MIKLKKIGLFLLGFTMFFGFNLQYTYGGLEVRDHYNGNWSQGEERASDPSVDEQTISSTHSISSGSKVMGDRSTGIIHLTEPQQYETKLGYALTLVQIAINWTLGMLSFVALVFMLYYGFLVLSAGSEDKNVSKGKNGIKTTGIALAGIAISRSIISIMIRFISYIGGA